MALTPSKKAFWQTSTWRQGRWGLLFILPCLLGLLVFSYGPSLVSFGLSFTYWNLLGTPQWAGTENYDTLFRDPLFWKALGNTFRFVGATTVFEVSLALLIALALNRKIRGIGALRTAYFLPFITPMVSVALVWGWLYDPQNGTLNQLLGLLGIPAADWLYDPKLALGSLVALNVWKNLGYYMIIFLAGLQSIPEEVLESAQLDGAADWQRLLHVILPLLTPTVFFVTTVCLINAFQAFDAIYLLTQGGPENSTQVLVYWMFKNAFEFYRIGPASAIAYSLVLIILAITWVQWTARKRWVLHES